MKGENFCTLELNPVYLINAQHNNSLATMVKNIILFIHMISWNEVHRLKEQAPINYHTKNIVGQLAYQRCAGSNNKKFRSILLQKRTQLYSLGHS